MISAVNGRKRALLTKSALEWHNKRCTAQSTLCVGNKKGKTELKAMCDFKKVLVSRYLGHDTIHVSPAQVSRCIDASMHRYAHSGVTYLAELSRGQHVRTRYPITQRWEPDSRVEKCQQPRSYEVGSDSGSVLRRNHADTHTHMHNSKLYCNSRT